MKIKTIAILVAVAALATSCSSHKTVLPYFTDLEGQQGTLQTMTYAPEIKPDDELFITVTSSEPVTTSYYNLPLSNPAKRAEINSTTSPKQQTYIVDSKGDINMPMLGTVHVAGMTTEQLQARLTEEIRKDVADAIVRVELLNFTVVVAGEVNAPSTIRVNRNRFSILDALSAAGDLTPYGERENVLIIREENGQRTYARINLNSSDVLTSPYFYLRQNDYIYVEPNNVRQANAKYNQDNAFKLSVISTIVSACSVVASLVIALSIK
ncbi:MAG: polysaccharide biosynthesis/export family protein [Bacteroidales bacterium]|nr:polysaccharide biosynthesis/export family protein [Bacteroidales bacterium]